MKSCEHIEIRSILVLILAIGFILSIAGLSFAESNIYDIERIVPNETSTYQAAMVAGDANAPTILSVWIDPNEIEIGSSINIYAKAGTSIYGFNFIAVEYLSPSHNYTKTSYLHYNLSSGLFQGTLSMADNDEEGDWTVMKVTVFDNAYNTRYYYNDEIYITSDLLYTTDVLQDLSWMDFIVYSEAQSEAISNMNRLGIMNNYPDGTFMPNIMISRAELAKILCTLTDLDDMAVSLSEKKGPYLDVSTEHWANGYVYAAFLKGYIKGDSDGYFHPDMGITHAEVITVLLRIIGYNDNLPGEWPADYIAKAANLGILDNVYFIADKSVTRGELATMIDKILFETVVKYSSSDNFFQHDLVFNKSLGKNIGHNLLMDNFLWALTGFLDVDYNSIEGQAIEDINYLGIMNGYPDGTFGADKTITNAEFSKLVCVITGFKTAAAGMADTTSPFFDVNIDHWANGWINVAAAQGFITGDANSAFRPDECLTQAEAVKVLLRTIGYNDNLTGDSPSDYIAQAAYLGILDDISFVSSKKITRGELSILINKILYLPIVRYVARDDLFYYDEKHIQSSGERFFHTLFEDHYGWAGFSYTVIDGTATITKYTESYKNLALPHYLTIPNTLDGYSVSRIGEGAFDGCIVLTRIEIPQSVIRVSNKAFAGCSNLDGIRFNSTTTTIYDSEYTMPYLTKIIGYNPSTAKDYATKYNRAFETLVAPTLQYISIATPAAKLKYTVGDQLDITGLEVTGTYSDNSTRIESITTANIIGFDSSEPATEQVLIVKIGDKTTTYTIRISAQQVDECFIATAAFGSKFEPAVVLLRYFRDEYLLTNNLGTAFVRFYYQNSPPIAAYIAHNNFLKGIVRALLVPIIALVYSIYHPIIFWALLLFLSLIMYRQYSKKHSDVCD